MVLGARELYVGCAVVLEECICYGEEAWTGREKSDTTERRREEMYRAFHRETSGVFARRVARIRQGGWCHSLRHIACPGLGEEHIRTEREEAYLILYTTCQKCRLEVRRKRTTFVNIELVAPVTIIPPTKIVT